MAFGFSSIRTSDFRLMGGKILGGSRRTSRAWTSYMVYYSPADHRNSSARSTPPTSCSSSGAKVPNDLIPINPLGLTITHFREDEAFK